MRATLAALAALAGTVVARCTNNTVPRFHVTLTPELQEGNERLHGEAVVDGNFAPNETLFLLPITIASRNTANYAPDDIVASDQHGSLELETTDDVGPFGQPTRFWMAKRAVKGPLKYVFTAYPEVVTDTISNVGPLFEIRENAGGILGSTWALIPTPDPTPGANYSITVSWNLLETESAAWTWGQGVGSYSDTFTGPIARLIQTFFAVGNLSAYPPIQNEEDSAFGMYWLEKPPMDVDAVAVFLQELLAYSTTFWRDTSGEPYRVFIRHNEERGNGGTALLRSFMTGWFSAEDYEQEGLETLLAHEMTHNWTPMSGGTLPEQSRYNEGLAEYYSLRLLWRSGNISVEQFVRLMNERLASYYTNPTVGMSDDDAHEIAWTQRAAQRIPYGRGLIHFANIDAQMRSMYNGTQSLDNLTLEFLEGCRGGSTCDNSGFFSLLRESLGESAVDEWNQVSSGTPLIEPVEGSLGPCFDAVQIPTNDTNTVVWEWEAKAGFNISSPLCQI